VGGIRDVVEIGAARHVDDEADRSPRQDRVADDARGEGSDAGNCPRRLLAVVVACMAQADAQVLVGGNDTKVWWDDAGKVLQRAPGKDTISIIDIKDRENPKILTNLELENSIFGPPTNLAVHPSGRPSETQAVPS
jgi:hypothetical protein